MQKIRWFFLIVLMVLAISLALQNNETTAFQLLWFKKTLPLSVLLLSGAGIGFLLGALSTASMLRSRRKKEKARNKASEKAAAEKIAEQAPVEPTKSEPQQATDSEATSPADADSPNPLS